LTDLAWLFIISVVAAAAGCSILAVRLFKDY